MANEEKEFSIDYTTLDIKGKLLVITSDDMLELSTLQTIRNKIVEMGGLGVMYLPDSDVRAETLDGVIEQLHTMKKQLEAKLV